MTPDRTTTIVHPNGNGAMIASPALWRHRAGLLRAASATAMITPLAVTLAAVLPAPSAAQVYNVPGGGSFSGIVPSSPTDGDTINLQGATATGDVAITIPIGATAPAADLTINGAAGGSVVTIDSTVTGTTGKPLFGNTTANPAILNLTGGPITFTGANVSANGGVINSINGITTNGANLTLSNNTVLGNGNGGAISASNAINLSSDLVINASDITLAGNWAAANGGSLFTGGGNISVGNGTGTVLVQNNSAHGAISIAAGYNSGGAISAGTAGVGGNPGTLTIDGSSISILGNTLTGTQQVTGGALFARGALALTSSGAVTISDNSASSTGTQGSYGGAVAAALNSVSPVEITAGTITVTGNTVSSAGGSQGGAIYSEDRGVGITLTATGRIDVEGNKAISSSNSSWGGAIMAYYTGVTLTGSEIVLLGNQAISSATPGPVTQAQGGAILALNGNVTLTASGKIDAEGNKATALTTGGGGVITAGGAVTLIGAEIVLSNNEATGDTTSRGGAISSKLATTLAGDVITMSNNTTSGSGGGIYTITGDATVGGALSTMTTINGNKSLNGDGGAIRSGGNITLWGTDISNNNAAGNGGAFYSVGGFTLNSTTADTITNNTAGGNGGAIWAGGNVALNALGGNITFSGNSQGTGANAIYLNNAAGTATATFNAAGRIITFFDPVQNNASNGLIGVTATGSGSVIFDASNYSALTDRWSQVYGNTEVAPGTALFVQNNAVYGALAADVRGVAGGSSFVVDSGATLAGGILGEVRADSFALNGILNIAGSATPGTAGGGFSTFTATSNNVNFGAGSQIMFNTYLNDASVQRSDLLVLNLNGSTITGTASVAVSNVGGAGALTVSNGIELVQVVGNNGTTAGAFNLAGPVTAGPYEYGLFRGSIDASAPQNWYLRSTLDCTLAPSANVCQTAPPPGPDPTPPPGPGPTPSPDIPHYSVETSLDAALPSMALLYGRNLMDTLHERVGEETDIGSPQSPPSQQGFYTKALPRQNASSSSIGWVRLIGTQGKESGDPLGIYGSGPQFDYNFYALQGGTDLSRHEHADGSRDHLGVTFAIGEARGTVTHFDGTTGIDHFNAYSLGGYWTHFGATGWYLDSVVQGTHYDANTTANRGFAAFTTRAAGIAGSVEAGKPFRFDNGYFIEPQAQLIYQSINFNDGNQATTSGSALVTYSNAESLAGRLGARIGHTWSLDNDAPKGRQLTVWIRPNLWHEFLGNPITQFSSADGPVPFRSSLGGTWGEINLGVSGQLNLNTTLFANASYQERFDAPGYAYNGKAGARISW